MQKFRPFPVLLALAVAAVVAPVIALQGASAQSIETASLAEAETVATTTTLSGPARYADSASPLDIAVIAGGGTPVPEGSQVRLERRVGGDWLPMEVVLTEADGHAHVDAPMSKNASDNWFRAFYDGDTTGDPAYLPSESGRVQIELRVRGSMIGLAGPDKVVDEQKVTLRVFWRTGGGIPVAGKVNLYRRAGKRWVRHVSGRTGADGRTTFTLRPRTDSRWRVRGLRQDWVSGRGQCRPRHRQPAAGRRR